MPLGLGQFATAQTFFMFFFAYKSNNNTPEAIATKKIDCTTLTPKVAILKILQIFDEKTIQTGNVSWILDDVNDFDNYLINSEQFRGTPKNVRIQGKSLWFDDFSQKIDTHFELHNIKQKKQSPASDVIFSLQAVCLQLFLVP